MKNLLDKIFSRSNNLDYISQSVKELTKQKFTNKVFEAISSYSPDSEIRYVGGVFVRLLTKKKLTILIWLLTLSQKFVWLWKKIILNFMKVALTRYNNSHYK